MNFEKRVQSAEAAIARAKEALDEDTLRGLQLWYAMGRQHAQLLGTKSAAASSWRTDVLSAPRVAQLAVAQDFRCLACRCSLGFDWPLESSSAVRLGWVFPAGPRVYANAVLLCDACGAVAEGTVARATMERIFGPDTVQDLGVALANSAICACVGDAMNLVVQQRRYDPEAILTPIEDAEAVLAAHIEATEPPPTAAAWSALLEQRLASALDEGDAPEPLEFNPAKRRRIA